MIYFGNQNNLALKLQQNTMSKKSAVQKKRPPVTFQLVYLYSTSCPTMTAINVVDRNAPQILFIKLKIDFLTSYLLTYTQDLSHIGLPWPHHSPALS